jgi:nucleoside-diphosphate-sugar epimerase
MALARPEDAIDAIPLPRSCVVLGYVQDRETVARASEGVDAIIHCAALLPNALHLGAGAFQDVNVGGTRAVMLEAAAQKVPRVVFFSTISVVDHVTRKIAKGQLFDFIEDAYDPYLESKIDAERFLMSRAASFQGHLAVIRPAFIYGPGNYAVWWEPLELTRAGRMRLLNGGKALLPLIYAEDIGRYVVGLLRTGGPAGTYDLHIVANPQPTSMRDVFDYIADEMGVARPRSVPALPLLVAANCIRWWPAHRRPGRLKLLTPARVLQYSRGYDLSQVLDLPRLSSIEMTDYHAGIQAMLHDFPGSVQAAE